MTVSARIILFQAMLALVIGAGMMLVSIEESLAALAAGAVCLVPNAYFAWRTSMERSPARLLAQSVGKVVVTLSLMAAVIVVLRPAPMGFFTAFVAMQLTYLLGAWTPGQAGSAATQQARQAVARKAEIGRAGTAGGGGNSGTVDKG